LRQHIRKEHGHLLPSLAISSQSNDPSIVSQAENMDCSSFNGACNDQSENSEESADTAIDAPMVDELGISQASLKFIMALSASSSMTVTAIEFVKRSTQALVQDIVQYLKARTSNVINSAIPESQNLPSVQHLMLDFDGWTNPFKGIETQQQLLSYLKRKEVYIQPKACKLGKCWEVRHDQSTGCQIQKKFLTYSTTYLLNRP
jgi:hypothetical protein